MLEVHHINTFQINVCSVTENNPHRKIWCERVEVTEVKLEPSALKTESVPFDMVERERTRHKCVSLGNPPFVSWNIWQEMWRERERERCLCNHSPYRRCGGSYRDITQAPGRPPSPSWITSVAMLSFCNQWTEVTIIRQQRSDVET